MKIIHDGRGSEGSFSQGNDRRGKYLPVFEPKQTESRLVMGIEGTEQKSIGGKGRVGRGK